MNPDLESAARAAVQITRAAPLFDQLVDMLLAQGVPASDTSNPAAGHAHRASLRAARERLDAHYPEFQRLYYALLHEHLGRQLPAVLTALSNELVQAYFKAQKAMEAELIDELQRLAEKMAPLAALDASRPGLPPRGTSARGKSESPEDDYDGTLPWGARLPGA